MRIIGLVGRKGSGKSLVAKRLAETHDFTVVPFAKPLKDMLRAIGLDDVHLTGSLKEKPCPLLLGRTPRWAMQSLGTEWGRDLIHPDLWVHLWREAALRARSSVVADDVRFVNEAATIRRLGGILVRVVRDIPDDPSPDSHASETGTEFIICSSQLENNGTVEQLAAGVDRLCSAILA